MKFSSIFDLKFQSLLFFVGVEKNIYILGNFAKQFCEKCLSLTNLLFNLFHLYCKFFSLNHSSLVK